MIHLDLNLFNEVSKAIDQHYQKQIHFLSFIFLIVFDIFVKKIKKFWNNFICLIPLLWLLECIVRISLESLEDIKLIAIAD